ncbi:MAG: hypothetical protein KF906_06090 [Actinobacteria bacterium]|nr:hypothetical protein [Actinomycetota bacterium]
MMRNLTTAQKQMIGFILVLAVVNVAYRLVYATGIQQTAALYVGIPTLLAVGLVLTPRSNSATGMLLKGSMLAMAIACVVLPEGLLCLLFALPLVALIAVIVGGPIDWARKRRDREGPTLMAVTLPLLVLSLEGVVGTPFDPADHATASVVVEATPAEVADALATTPTFDAELPMFLTLGFNRPVGATGAGIEVGDRRSIHFSGGSHDDHPLRLLGLVDGGGHDHHSQMDLTVVESAPGRVVFRIDDDTTMTSRWADLRRAVVTWRAVGDGTTRVSWTLEYDRLLFPTAYFAPLQRYGMGQSAEYLLDAVVVDRVA